LQIVTDIASFFFTFQSSAFWHFKMPKRRCLMTVNIKKIDRVSPGFDQMDRVPGRLGFSRPIFKRVFTSTRTGPRPGSTSRANPGFKSLLCCLQFASRYFFLADEIIIEEFHWFIQGYLIGLVNCLIKILV